MIANEAVELTRAIVTDIRRVVDKADITRQAVELMRSGVPEDAAFYWAVPVAYALQAATKRAGAAPLDVERIARALQAATQALGGIDLGMADVLFGGQEPFMRVAEAIVDADARLTEHNKR